MSQSSIRANELLRSGDDGEKTSENAALVLRSGVVELVRQLSARFAERGRVTGSGCRCNVVPVPR